MSEVHTPAASPKSTSLPIRTASSSVSKGMTDSTGPNTSSCAIRMSLVTPVKMVGWTNWPPRSWRPPPSTQVAPSPFATSM